ncbi:ABC-type transport auxiliary lipoprotein family protein [Polymorphobacter fuscus]|uniref:ABC transporter n=1 Tax=Sandarakinorhabdus fusca TaxID=1439888 RepID=A0A7C9KW01_9SPHN|nr:ABC-type transport auxiliary lipoprotein family protein [Polymorphobacter fuscus]KAB7649004.1 ABC transporter [Polymorphobacter fuscus]MQT16605.1 ABC transporter [Polymorphobacter fuscus]NJC07105.1 cholesterol transport system auxiliary component [Polymorphobacter fuscus]
MKSAIVLALSCGALLAACGPLVQIGGNSPPAQSLLVLSATTPPAPYSGATPASATVGVEIPAVPATLQTLRLPVDTTATEVTYLVGATWAEQPNRQFQRLLADTMTAKGIAVVDARQVRTPPVRSLTGTLRSFGLDVTDPANPVVRVRYDAQLSGNRTATNVMLRRFDAVEPVAVQTPLAVAAALNRAANRVAVDVAGWVAG